MSPLCSRNARPQKALVGRAQWGAHPGYPWENVHEQAWKDHIRSLAAALLDGHFEQPAGYSGATTMYKGQAYFAKSSFRASC
jgi:hypothetical protein